MARNIFFCILEEEKGKKTVNEAAQEMGSLVRPGGGETLLVRHVAVNGKGTEKPYISRGPEQHRRTTVGVIFASRETRSSSGLFIQS